MSEQHPTRFVPCGPCNQCCRGDAIFLHIEEGDELTGYETESTPDGGRLMLRHQENGDCIYLDRDKGCTIHDRRPIICREMDCRMMLKQFGEKRMRAMGWGELAYAARRCLRREAAKR